MRFVWDENKRVKNLRKHKLDFKDAPRLFAGPFLRFPDVREDYGEERWIAIGQIEGRTGVATFVERGEAVRIISFRRAARWEREIYYRGFED